MEFDHNDQPLAFALATGAASPELVDLRPYHILRTLLEGVRGAQQVYAALLLQPAGSQSAGAVPPPISGDFNVVPSS
ncbi:hypothetical protein HUU39_20020 [candidate division KSB1 bacterium]|nr:hypothetical protein [candidate division KSB1 bacterium]